MTMQTESTYSNVNAAATAMEELFGSLNGAPTIEVKVGPTGYLDQDFELSSTAPFAIGVDLKGRPFIALHLEWEREGAVVDGKCILFRRYTERGSVWTMGCPGISPPIIAGAMELSDVEVICNLLVMGTARFQVADGYERSPTGELIVKKRTQKMWLKR